MSGGDGQYPSAYIGQHQEPEKQEVEPREAPWELQGPGIQQEPRKGLVRLTLGGFRGFQWMKGLRKLGFCAQVDLVF